MYSFNNNVFTFTDEDADAFYTQILKSLFAIVRKQTTVLTVENTSDDKNDDESEDSDNTADDDFKEDDKAPKGKTKKVKVPINVSSGNILIPGYPYHDRCGMIHIDSYESMCSKKFKEIGKFIEDNRDSFNLTIDLTKLSKLSKYIRDFGKLKLIILNYTDNSLEFTFKNNIKIGTTLLNYKSISAESEKVDTILTKYFDDDFRDNCEYKIYLEPLSISYAKNYKYAYLYLDIESNKVYLTEKPLKVDDISETTRVIRMNMSTIPVSTNKSANNILAITYVKNDDEQLDCEKILYTFKNDYMMFYIVVGILKM